MPIGVHHAGRLADFARDQRQLFFGKSENVNLDVEYGVRTVFGGNTPRHDVEILEALENASECAGISVRNDPKPQ
jgi:hypothetical protein